MRIRERFNPRAPCGARLVSVLLFSVCSLISTHAPLAGRDHEFADDPSPLSISTHAPLAGRDT